MSKNKNLLRVLGQEILLGFLGILGTHIETKIGFGIFLILIGILMLVVPFDNEEHKPILFYIIGYLLTFVGIYLFYLRFKEIKIKNG